MARKKHNKKWLVAADEPNPIRIGKEYQVSVSEISSSDENDNTLNPLKANKSCAAFLPPPTSQNLEKINNDKNDVDDADVISFVQWLKELMTNTRGIKNPPKKSSMGKQKSNVRSHDDLIDIDETRAMEFLTLNCNGDIAVARFLSTASLHAGRAAYISHIDFLKANLNSEDNNDADVSNALQEKLDITSKLLLNTKGRGNSKKVPTTPVEIETWKSTITNMTKKAFYNNNNNNNNNNNTSNIKVYTSSIEALDDLIEEGFSFVIPADNVTMLHEVTKELKLLLNKQDTTKRWLADVYQTFALNIHSKPSLREAEALLSQIVNMNLFSEEIRVLKRITASAKAIRLRVKDILTLSSLSDNDNDNTTDIDSLKSLVEDMKYMSISIPEETDFVLKLQTSLDLQAKVRTALNSKSSSYNNNTNNTPSSISLSDALALCEQVDSNGIVIPELKLLTKEIQKSKTWLNTAKKYLKDHQYLHVCIDLCYQAHSLALDLNPEEEVLRREVTLCESWIEEARNIVPISNNNDNNNDGELYPESYLWILSVKESLDNLSNSNQDASEALELNLKNQLKKLDNLSLQIIDAEYLSCEFRTRSWKQTAVGLMGGTSGLSSLESLKDHRLLFKDLRSSVPSDSPYSTNWEVKEMEYLEEIIRETSAWVKELKQIQNAEITINTITKLLEQSKDLKADVGKFTVLLESRKKDFNDWISSANLLYDSIQRKRETGNEATRTRISSSTSAISSSSTVSSSTSYVSVDTMKACIDQAKELKISHELIEQLNTIVTFTNQWMLNVNTVVKSDVNDADNDIENMDKLTIQEVSNLIADEFKIPIDVSTEIKTLKKAVSTAKSWDSLTTVLLEKSHILWDQDTYDVLKYQIDITPPFSSFTVTDVLRMKLVHYKSVSNKIFQDLSGHIDEIKNQIAIAKISLPISPDLLPALELRWELYQWAIKTNGMMLNLFHNVVENSDNNYNNIINSHTITDSDSSGDSDLVLSSWLTLLENCNEIILKVQKSMGKCKPDDVDTDVHMDVASDNLIQTQSLIEQSTNNNNNNNNDIINNDIDDNISNSNDDVSALSTRRSRRKCSNTSTTVNVIGGGIDSHSVSSSSQASMISEPMQKNNSNNPKKTSSTKLYLSLDKSRQYSRLIPKISHVTAPVIYQSQLVRELCGDVLVMYAAVGEICTMHFMLRQNCRNILRAYKDIGRRFTVDDGLQCLKYCQQHLILWCREIKYLTNECKLSLDWNAKVRDVLNKSKLLSLDATKTLYKDWKKLILIDQSIYSRFSVVYTAAVHWMEKLSQVETQSNNRQNKVVIYSQILSHIKELHVQLPEEKVELMESFVKRVCICRVSSGVIELESHTQDMVTCSSCNNRYHLSCLGKLSGNANGTSTTNTSIITSSFQCIRCDLKHLIEIRFMSCSASLHMTLEAHEKVVASGNPNYQESFVHQFFLTDQGKVVYEFIRDCVSVFNEGNVSVLNTLRNPSSMKDSTVVGLTALLKKAEAIQESNFPIVNMASNTFLFLRWAVSFLVSTQQSTRLSHTQFRTLYRNGLKALGTVSNTAATTTTNSTVIDSYSNEELKLKLDLNSIHYIVENVRKELQNLIKAPRSQAVSSRQFQAKLQLSQYLICDIPEQTQIRCLLEDNLTRYCICGGYNDGRFMLSCDKCNKWFHGECVFVKSNSIKVGGSYTCPKCCHSMNVTYDFKPGANVTKKMLALFEKAVATNAKKRRKKTVPSTVSGSHYKASTKSNKKARK